MKKGWKIVLLSLGTLLGLVVIAVVVLCWLLFTPARLTAIVNKLAADHLTCENHFEQVDVSLFKTWPNVGVRVDNVVLVNPYLIHDSHPLAALAAQNDTLAHIGMLTVGIDLKSFLKDRSIVVRQLRIEDVQTNLYTAQDGWTNLDIFARTDESEHAPADTTSGFSTTVQLEKLVIHHLTAQYCNLQNHMLAQADRLNLKLKGSWVENQLEADAQLTVADLWVDMRDSLGNSNLYAHLEEEPSLSFVAKGTMADLNGRLMVVLPQGQVAVGGNSFVSDAMLASRHAVLTVEIPFNANLDDMRMTLKDKASLSLLDYKIRLSGDVALALEGRPMEVDVRYSIDDWKVGSLLAILPPFVTSGFKGMSVDALLSLDGTAKGVIGNGILPLVKANAKIKKGTFSAPHMLPMPLRDVRADLSADLNLSSDSARSGPSRVDVRSLFAKAQKSTLLLEGSVDNLLDDMLLDARIRGNLNLSDLSPFLPDTMPITLHGSSNIDLNVNGRLSQITKLNLDKVKANGTVAFSQLDVLYDSIHATSPKLDVVLALPQTKSAPLAQNHELLSVRITGGHLNVKMDNNGLDAHVDEPDIQVALPNILDKDQPLAANFDIRLGKVDARLDSMLVYSDTLKLKGSVKNDKGKDNLLQQWNPDLDIDIHRGVLALANMSDPIRLTDFEFNYKPEVINIVRANILWGVSDYHLQGRLYGLENWLNHTEMLTGEASFTSGYADIDQLMGILSGMGTDKDTLARQRAEDNVPKEANPFIVPKDVNLKLRTHLDRCVAFNNDLDDLSGSVTVNDGTAILDQVGFTCKAARMELTGVYKSPRVNHLFVGLDFHLLDVQIEELLDMIPSIDTLVPMLSAFEGRANFHLAAEANLDAYYRPKMSTLIGAAAISGKDLVVMDNATVAQMAKLLQFKNWREKDSNIGVDSISVEAQVFRKEVVVYPFLLNLHNYQLCIAGRHTLDNNCNYHLELLKCPMPVRMAVDVNGSIKKPNVALGKIQYADLFKPEKQNKLEARTLEIKRLVRQALEANVRK